MPLLLPADCSALTTHPGWGAFRARLDAGLDALDLGWYQGSYLEQGSEYALAYRVLKAADPVAATAYAGRALGVLLSGLRAYQKGGANSFERVGLGDGAATAFALRPGAHATAYVSAAPAAVVTVTRGAADEDRVGVADWLRVWDDAGAYARGVDWAPADFPLNIRWLPGGRRPAAGATYRAEGAAAPWPPSRAPVADGVVRLPTPPPAGHHVFAAYLYDEPGRPNLQTADGLGGFRSIYSDTGYASRYLGKHTALTLDWLWDFGGFAAPEREEAMGLLVRWADHYKAAGYARESLQSNYGAGAYCSWVLSGLALRGRHPDADRVLAEALAFRAAALPQLVGDPPSLRGGFWAEGWSYGPLAVQNLLLPALALEHELGTDVAAERAFAADVAAHLVHAYPDEGRTVYDGGDWFAYPAPFPEWGLHPVLWACGGGPAARAVCRRAPGASYLDLLWPDFWAAAALDPAAQPLSRVAAGTGLAVARSDWGPAQVFVAAQCGAPVAADHQSFAPGQVQLWAGGTPLLVNAPVVVNEQSGAPKTRLANVVAVDCPDRRVQNYPGAMGYWYGPAGVTLAAADTGDRFTARMDYGAAYSHNTAPGGGGPVDFLARDVTFLRPDTLVVYDRVGVRGEPAYPWAVQWATAAPAARDGDWWVVRQDGQTLYVAALDAADGAHVPGRVEAEGKAHFLRFAPAAPAARAKVVTVAAVGRKPGVALSPSGLVVDGRAVPLDPAWPAPLAAPDAPPPDGGPSPPPPPPPPSRPMPPPTHTLDAATAPAALRRVAAAHNGHPALAFGPDDRVDLGDLLAAAPGCGVVALYRKVAGGAHNFPLVARAGQLAVNCFPSVGGSLNAFTTTAGENTQAAAVSGDVTAFGGWGAAYAPVPQGMAAAHGGVVVTGNPPRGGPLAQPGGPLVVNPAGGAFELVGMDLYDTGLSAAELKAALAALLDRYAAAPSPPPPPVVPPPPPPPLPGGLYRLTLPGTALAVDVRLEPLPA